MYNKDMYNDYIVVVNVLIMKPNRLVLKQKSIY